MKGTLYEDRYKFMIAFPSVILRMKKKFSDKICRKNQNTHFIFTGNFCFRKWCCL